MLPHLGSEPTAAAYSTTITGGRHIALLSCAARWFRSRLTWPVVPDTVSPLCSSCPHTDNVAAFAKPTLQTSATRLLGSTEAVSAQLLPTNY